MVLLVDNYDSFTFNLAQYLGELGAELRIRRNDEVTIEEISRWQPAAIVISPGPGRPEDAGISVEIVRTFGPRVPILGVCLGHQAIGVACGARVGRAPRPMHGKTSLVRHDGRQIFRGLPETIEVARYHSLLVEADSVPPALAVTACAVDDGTIMSLAHREWPVVGVQFHPESIRTREGRQMLKNFLEP